MPLFGALYRQLYLETIRSSPACSRDANTFFERGLQNEPELSLYATTCQGSLPSSGKRSPFNQRTTKSTVSRPQQLSPADLRIGRMFLHRTQKGSMLIIRLAEKCGWTAREVFGINMEALYTIKDMSSSAQGINLLLQFVRQLLQYNPDKQSGTSLHPAVHEALDIIKREIDGDLSLQRLASRIGVHPFHLSRLFKQEIGYTFSDSAVCGETTCEV